MRRSTIVSSLNTAPRGFSLIEVLVALLVLSIGLLGLAALQTTSLKYNTDSYTRTQATLLAYDIIDRMRSNLKGVDAGNYNVPDAASAASKISAYKSCSASASGCGCDLSGANCSTSTLATYDLGKWYEGLEASLPGASTNLATISAPSRTVTITIQWKDRDLPTPKQQTWTVEL